MKTNKLKSYVVLACILLGFLGAQAQCYTPLFPSGNVITDPECNNYPNTASGWKKGWGNGTAITGANAYCGTSIQTAGGTCKGSIDYDLTGKLLPNTSYRFKCMLYSNGDAHITLNGCGINGLSTDFQLTKNTTSAWQAVDFYFITGTLGAAQNLWINSCSASATDVRLDNLEIFPATEPVVEIPMEPMDSGKFVPTWESLKQYGEAPEWYQDAKFGIWAHWGPQCQPEQGDWFARFMYYSGGDRNWFTNKYGSDTKLGFKEVINDWKAENWQPDSIVKLYKDAGAKYFFALGNHHDNLDLWDSKYQEWNTVNVGPKRDLIAGWEKATRANGLRFGVSIHASHAWSWYEPSQSYDGNLTKADSLNTDGTRKWWAGLD
ncbi:MAG TPA: alpha-L-fucosidase, partial [Paludibacter sp.]|nr:alpha-L-fucosidase [Paludibacter sp.]